MFKRLVNILPCSTFPKESVLLSNTELQTRNLGVCSRTELQEDPTGTPWMTRKLRTQPQQKTSSTETFAPPLQEYLLLGVQTSIFTLHQNVRYVFVSQETSLIEWQNRILRFQTFGNLTKRIICQQKMCQKVFMLIGGAVFSSALAFSHLISMSPTEITHHHPDPQMSRDQGWENFMSTHIKFSCL